MKIIKPNYKKIEKAINEWLKENELTEKDLIVIDNNFENYNETETDLINLFTHLSCSEGIINFGVETVQNQDNYWIQTYYYSEKINKTIILDSPDELEFENMQQIMDYIKEQEESITNIESRIN